MSNWSRPERNGDDNKERYLALLSNDLTHVGHSLLRQEGPRGDRWPEWNPH